MLKEIGRTHVIPGFRKGHVPFGELKRRFGKQLTSDVINDTVYRAVIDYITENKLNVMGHPMPVEVKEAFEEGDQEFKYDLALIPTSPATRWCSTPTRQPAAMQASSLPCSM